MLGMVNSHNFVGPDNKKVIRAIQGFNMKVLIRVVESCDTTTLLYNRVKNLDI
ncbi:MAG: hypothetical protein ACOX0L_08610 [Natronincolaceae bacterium]|jgi:hypothetical protein|nr:hypothetical protein [Clostridiales bacterium]